MDPLHRKGHPMWVALNRHGITVSAHPTYVGLMKHLARCVVSADMSWTVKFNPVFPVL